MTNNGRFSLTFDEKFGLMVWISGALPDFQVWILGKWRWFQPWILGEYLTKGV